MLKKDDFLYIYTVIMTEKWQQNIYCTVHTILIRIQFTKILRLKFAKI